MAGTKETITFENAYHDWYGSTYAGMDWTSIYPLNGGVLNELGYCDTGYNNALRGNFDAFSSPFGDGYGIFESQNFDDPFKLKSMIVASAWNGEEGFTFNSYTYRHGQVRLKASIYIDVTQGSQTINFGNYGKGFKNIVAVNILSGTEYNGHPGSTYTYGSPTYGYQMAFDNVKVVFANGIPVHRAGHHALLPVQLLHHRHHGTIAGHATPDGSIHHPATAHADGHCVHRGGRAYHSQLLSLHSNEGTLPSQFHLPAVEHFGN